MSSNGDKNKASAYEEKAAEAARRKQSNASQPGAFSSSGGSTAAAADPKAQVRRDLEALGQPGAVSSSGGAVTAAVNDPKAQVRQDLAALGASKPGAYSSSGDDPVLTKMRAQAPSAAAQPGAFASSSPAPTKNAGKARVQEDIARLQGESAPGAHASSSPAAAKESGKARVQEDIARLQGESTPGAHASASRPAQKAAGGTGSEHLASLENEIVATSRAAGTERQRLEDVKSGRAAASGSSGVGAELDRVEQKVRGESTGAPGAYSSSSAAGRPAVQAELDRVERKVRSESTTPAAVASLPSSTSEGMTERERVEHIKSRGPSQTAYSTSVADEESSQMERKPAAQGGLAGAFSNASVSSSSNSHSTELNNGPDEELGMKEHAQEQIPESAPPKESMDEPKKVVDVEKGNAKGKDVAMLEKSQSYDNPEGLAEAKPVLEDDFAPENIVMGVADEELKKRKEEKDQKCRTWGIRGGIIFLLVVAAIVAAVVVTSKDDKKEVATKEPTAAPSAAPTPAPTAYAVSLPKFTLEALDNPDSPQSLAYQWLRADPMLEDRSEEKKAQRMALATIYYATNGENWAVNSDWLSYEVEECKWFSKFNFTSGEYNLKPEDFFTFADVLTDVPLCSDDGYYLALVLGSNGLDGPLPPEISLLSSLQLIELSGNPLSGTVPAEIGLLTNLRELSLGQTEISGSLPPELGTLESLQYLTLRDVGISGPLPSEIGNLRAMKELEIYSTKVSGTVPLEYYNLRNLTYFVLSNNTLTGTVATEIGLLGNQLEVFRANRNGLSGELPSEVGGLIGLTNLGLDRNDFTGTIPTEIGALLNIQQIWLESNHFTGTIPSEFGSLPNVTDFVLGNNILSGSVPVGLFSRPKLFGVEISRNPLLMGSIPTEVRLATNINNILTYELPMWSGTIPSEIGTLTNLMFLWLFESNLQGTIPTELANLPLMHLRVEGNPLTGTFPPAIADNAPLMYLSLNSTSMSGTLTDPACSIQVLFFDCPNICGCNCACTDEELVVSGATPEQIGNE